MPSGSAERFARNSAFGTIAGVLTALSSVATSVIVAHALGVAATGTVAFAFWVATVAACVADLGIQTSLSRYLPELIGSGCRDEAERLAGLLWRRLAVSCVVATLGFAGGAWWYRRNGTISGADAMLWCLVGGICVSQALAGFTYGYLRGIQRFDRWALLTVIGLGCQLSGVALGSICFGTAGALGGYCAGSIVPAAMSLHHAASRPLPSRELRTRVRRYALYAWAGALSSTIVWSRAELFFLQRSTGSAAAGLFTVSLTLANLASQGPMLLTAGLLPFFAQSFGEGAHVKMKEGYATATRVLAFLILPVCFGMAALMPVALPLLYGRAFAEAVPAATVLVLFASIGAISSVGANVIMAMDRSDVVFVSGIVAAALAVATGLTVIPAFGLMGAAWSRVAIQLVAVLLGSGFLHWRLGFPLPLGGLGRLLLAAGLCGVTARVSLGLATGVASLVLAVGVGAVAYVIATRALRALSREDASRLHVLFGRFAAPIGTACAFGLELLAPDRGRPAAGVVAAPQGSADNGA